MHRLFFALWPDATVRTAIDGAANALSSAGADGRRTDPARAHLTLQFLGTVATLPEWLPDAIRAAQSVQSSAFALCIDRVGAFAPNRVMWLGARAVPDGLLALRGKLRSALAMRGVPLPPEAAFQPHVTIRRGALEIPDVAVDPIEWRVDRFVLIDSESGYRILGEWPLRTA